MQISRLCSPHWEELGFTQAQAQAWYEPESAAPEDLQVLEERGLLSQGRRVPAQARAGALHIRYDSPFQRIEVYEHAVFLNGTIQLEARECRYHNELMVARPLGLLSDPRRVLILGGGLGMGARLALESPTVDYVQLVEKDADVVRLASTIRMLRRANGKSLTHPHVHIRIQDAFRFLEEDSDRWDLIVFDCDLTATRQDPHLTLPALFEFFRQLPTRARAVSTRIPLDDDYMELVDAMASYAGNELERAARVVREFWPEAILTDFLSVYCGRELHVTLLATKEKAS